MIRWLRVTVEIIVVVLFVLLLYQNWTLKHPATVPRPGGAERFGAGDIFPKIPVVDRLGRPSTLGFRAGRTLLLIADPGCPACETQLRALAPDAVILSTANFATTRSSPLSSFPGMVYSLAEIPPDVRFRRVPQVVIVEAQRIIRTCADTKSCT